MVFGVNGQFDNSSIAADFYEGIKILDKNVIH
jgi:hypothetical protein